MANSYTYRQATKLVEYLVREKFMVVTEVASAFFNKGKGKQSPSPDPSIRSQAGLPSWYVPRKGAKVNVVSLDGPMAALQPFLGKAAIRKGSLKHKRR